ncbi:MAG: CPBP family intramembrane metalloprotease domain-containing protein [Flavobacteriaceae bacterium TMED184]|nr:MAG: CPBP family intramembrane metalloprotease domain-containing protein [Flavobacteriaceae bacterium TMED184]
MFLSQVNLSRKDFLKYLLGSFLVIIFNILGQIPLFVYLVSQSLLDQELSDPNEIFSLIPSNTGLFLMLLPFAISLLGLWFILKKLHQQDMRIVATSRDSIDWSRVFFSFAIWGFLSSVIILSGYIISPEDYEINFKLTPFLILACIAVILIPLQTSFEEYLFRGYLMQGFAGLFRNRWAPLFMTSIIFGCLHLANPEVDKLGYNLVWWYMGTGFVLGIMTLMDEGIELALGVHASNNLFAALLVTADWTVFQTESILKYTGEPSLSKELIFSFIIFYPLLLFIFYKKYKWSDFKSRLFGKL